MIRNTTSSWGSVARWFHWILGVTIIGMLAYGWWMNHIPARPDRFFYRSIHADIGYLLLVLIALRLIWRAINPTPALPVDTPVWQRIAASISHGALYLVTFVVIMLGFLLQWPTILTLAMFPVLVAMYVHLAHTEEAEMRREFGAEYDRYAAVVPAWVPRLGGRAAENPPILR